MDERRSAAGPFIVAAVLLIAAGLASYVAGYFAFGTRFDLPANATGPERCRGFERDWMVDVYQPMGAVEEAVTGTQVRVVWKTILDLEIALRQAGLSYIPVRFELISLTDVDIEASKDLPSPNSTDSENNSKATEAD